MLIGAGEAGPDGHAQRALGVIGPGAAAVVCKGDQCIKFILGKSDAMLISEGIAVGETVMTRGGIFLNM